MAEVLGWSRLTWRLTCSCFTFSRIRTHFKKSCFILMVNGNKISWFVGLLYTTTAELAEPAEPGTDGNAPISDVENVSPLQFAHLICIWIPFRNLFGRTHLYFICKIWNKFLKSTNWMPMLRFCVSKTTICASKLTHSFEFCASRITICASCMQWRALDTTLEVVACPEAPSAILSSMKSVSWVYIYVIQISIQAINCFFVSKTIVQAIHYYSSWWLGIFWCLILAI